MKVSLFEGLLFACLRSPAVLRGPVRAFLVFLVSSGLVCAPLGSSFSLLSWCPAGPAVLSGGSAILAARPAGGSAVLFHFPAVLAGGSTILAARPADGSAVCCAV